MLAGRFDFLRKDFPNIAEDGNSADNFLNSKTEICMMYVGRLFDGVVKTLCSRNGINTISEEYHGKDRDNFELIRELLNRGIIDTKIYRILENLRHYRNANAHNEDHSRNQCIDALNQSLDLCKWLAGIYGTKPSKSKPKPKPQPKLEPTKPKIKPPKQHEHKIHQPISNPKPIKTSINVKTMIAVLIFFVSVPIIIWAGHVLEKKHQEELSKIAIKAGESMGNIIVKFVNMAEKYKFFRGSFFVDDMGGLGKKPDEDTPIIIPTFEPSGFLNAISLSRMSIKVCALHLEYCKMSGAVDYLFDYYDTVEEISYRELQYMTDKELFIKFELENFSKEQQETLKAFLIELRNFVKSEEYHSYIKSILEFFKTEKQLKNSHKKILKTLEDFLQN